MTDNESIGLYTGMGLWWIKEQTLDNTTTQIHNVFSACIITMNHNTNDLGQHEGDI